MWPRVWTRTWRATRTLAPDGVCQRNLWPDLCTTRSAERRTFCWVNTLRMSEYIFKIHVNINSRFYLFESVSFVDFIPSCQFFFFLQVGY